MDQHCAFCDAKAPHRCASCSSVWYCSAEHQKEDWKVHRKNCSYFKIVEDSEYGKGFIATRDIKPGTVILDEKPVAGAPSNAAPNACVTCGLISGGMGHRCSRCKWPVCSVECEKSPIHSENECRVFASQKFDCNPFTFGFGFSPKDFVMGIRVGLLKLNDPLKYQKVLQLCSEYSLPDEDDIRRVEITLKKLLDSVKGLEIGYEEIAKLLRIFQINSFTGLPQNYYNLHLLGLGTEMFAVSGLYLQSSRINHSCIPNCHWTQVSKPEWKIRIRTTREVKKGEVLTVYYWPWEIDEPTPRRQLNIRKFGNFQCKCARCKDPTELGTYRDGVVCKSCRGKKTLGYFLPANPLNLSTYAIWKCNRCDGFKTAGEILLQVNRCEEEVRCMQMMHILSPDENMIDSCKSFVNKTSGIILHPNHWVIQRAMTNACKLLSTFPGVTSRVDMSEYLIQCIKHLLSIQDLLTPGITSGRAVLQDQLSKALHYEVRAHYAQFSEGYFDLVERNSEESLVLSKEALKFFKNELPLTQGVVTRAMSIEKNIRKMLENLAKLRMQRLSVCASDK